MRILLVEDDQALAEGLTGLLRGAGYALDHVNDGVSAEALAASENFDLVILDLNLPQMDGLAVLRAMRSRGNGAAVMILTARGAPEDRVKGLDLGADDYLIKPFNIAEFEARVRSLLRRHAGLKSAIVGLGPLVLDLNARSFTLNGAHFDLPARERGLLELLILKAGKVVSRDAILQSLTGLDDDLSANAIEQYASRLRKRLAPHGLNLTTARGIGYYLDYHEV